MLAIEMHLHRRGDGSARDETTADETGRSASTIASVLCRVAAFSCPTIAAFRAMMAAKGIGRDVGLNDRLWTEEWRALMDCLQTVVSADRADGATG